MLQAQPAGCGNLLFPPIGLLVSPPKVQDASDAVFLGVFHQLFFCQLSGPVNPARTDRAEVTSLVYVQISGAGGKNQNEDGDSKAS